MKNKTEARHLAILTAAAEVFRKIAVQLASLSDMRERIRGSKATLDNYGRHPSSQLARI